MSTQRQATIPQPTRRRLSLLAEQTADRILRTLPEWHPEWAPVFLELLQDQLYAQSEERQP